MRTTGTPVEALTILGSGAATFSSSVSTTELKLNNISALIHVNTYNVIRDTDARNAIILGNSATPQNFYDNTDHIFRNRSGATEYMRITSGGSVLIGKTSTDFSAVGTHLINNGQATLTVASDAILYLNRTGSDGIIQYFYKDTSVVGSISVTASATAFNTSSDYRLKQDLKNYNGLELVSAIKTYDYEWKSDKTRMYGVLAHELAEVIPYAVTGEKDGKEMQGVDYSKIVPVLIKAIQELNAEIKILKNK